MRAGKGVASVRLLLAGMWGYGVCGLWIFWHGLNLGGVFFFLSWDGFHGFVGLVLVFLGVF